MDSAKDNKNRSRKYKPLLRTPARASIWYTAASFISRGVGFLVTPLFTRILRAEDYGVYPLYCGWFSVISVIMTLEVGGAFLYRGFAEFKDRREDFTKSALTLLLSVFLSISFIFFLFIDKISALSGLPVFLLTVLAVHTLAEGMISVICTSERYFYGYRRVFSANVIPAFLSPILALILIEFLPPYARSIGAMAASLITLALLIFSGRYVRGAADKKIMKYIIFSALSVLPSVLAGVLLSNADKLMIAGKFGSAALAKYSVAHSLGLVLTFLTVGLYGALKPWIMRKLSEGAEGSIFATIRLLLLFFCLFTAVLLLLTPELFAFLAPSDYSGALAETYLLALAVLPMFLSNVFSSVLLHKGKACLTSLLTILAALLNIGLNFLFFMRFSYSSAATSFLISYFILALSEWLALGKSRPKSRAVLIGAPITALAARVFYLLRGNILLRFSALALLLPSLIFTAYKIFKLVREK